MARVGQSFSYDERPPITWCWYVGKCLGSQTNLGGHPKELETSLVKRKTQPNFVESKKFNRTRSRVSSKVRYLHNNILIYSLGHVVLLSNFDNKCCFAVFFTGGVKQMRNFTIQHLSPSLSLKCNFFKWDVKVTKIEKTTISILK